MTDEQLRSIIDRVNDGNRDCAFLRPLLGNVDYGIVWLTNPDGSAWPPRRYSCFMIRDEGGRYVGAVLEMDGEHDLHSFVEQEHRRQGIMTRTLCEVVLPYLKCQGMEELTVTLHSVEGIRLAEKLGFTLDETLHTATLDLSTAADVEFPAQQPAPLSDARLEQMRKQVRKAAQRLLRIADELEVAHAGSDFLSPEIRGLADEVSDLDSKLKDERDGLIDE